MHTRLKWDEKNFLAEIWAEIQEEAGKMPINSGKPPELSWGGAALRWVIDHSVTCQPEAVGIYPPPPLVTSQKF